MTTIESDDRRASAPRSFVARHPIGLLLVAGTAFVWVTQMGSLLAGVDVMPAKLAELVVLLGLATWITARVGGRAEVRRLFAGLTRWRLGRRYLLLVGAMPLLTLAVALATGTLHAPSAGWAAVGTTYLLFLVLGAVTGNLWEETVWAGFVQGRLMAARGLLVGSLLTALPFFLMHLPLAFEADGWKGTTWGSAAVDWALILLAAPFQRYLIGTLLVDTKGSTLAAGIMHASINAAGAMAVIPGGWQHIPALVVLTVAVTAYRARRGLSSTRGYSPAIAPGTPPVPDWADAGNPAGAGVRPGGRR
jgi:membrane protease YdiL (CAAX protease family)